MGACPSFFGDYHRRVRATYDDLREAVRVAFAATASVLRGRRDSRGRLVVWRGRFGGVVVLRRIEVHLGEDVLVPEIAGWRRERLPKIPDVAFMELTPDWICEVTSRESATHCPLRVE